MKLTQDEVRSAWIAIHAAVDHKLRMPKARASFKTLLKDYGRSITKPRHVKAVLDASSVNLDAILKLFEDK